MGTTFDCLDERAHTADSEASPEAQRNRTRLRDAMQRRGFVPYAKEWWHFTYPPDAQIAPPPEQWKNASGLVTRKDASGAGHLYIWAHAEQGANEVTILAPVTPELLATLASSIVLLADKHPRELGAVSETELLQGKFQFEELGGLSPSETQVKPGFYVGGNIYSDWASVPENYKVSNSDKPDPRRSTGTLFKFSW